MKNIIFITLFLFSASLYSQTDAQIEKQAKPMIAMYKMDNGQAAQYLSILKTKAKSMSEVNASKGIDKNEAIENVETSYEKSFLAILNDDQKKIFEAQQIIANGIKEKMPKAPKKQNR